MSNKLFIVKSKTGIEVYHTNDIKEARGKMEGTGRFIHYSKKAIQLYEKENRHGRSRRH